MFLFATIFPVRQFMRPPQIKLFDNVHCIVVVVVDDIIAVVIVVVVIVIIVAICRFFCTLCPPTWVVMALGVSAVSLPQPILADLQMAQTARHSLLR